MNKPRKTVNTLSGMQRKFFHAWMRHGNATKAAEEAGYKEPNKQGPRLAKHRKIKEAVESYYLEQHMETAEVVGRLSQQGRGLYANYFKVDDRGRVFVDVQSMIDDGLGHLIKKVSWDGKGNQTIEFYDVQNALVQVGRSLGIFRDGVDFGGAVPITFIEAVPPNGAAENGGIDVGGEDG